MAKPKGDDRVLPSTVVVEKMPKIVLLAIGYTMLIGSKLGLKFRFVEGETFGEDFLYEADSKLMKYMGGSPGTVYEVPKTDKGIIYTQATVMKRWPNQVSCLQWQAESRAAERTFLAQKEALKIAKTEELDMLLYRLNQVYTHSVGRHRSQLLAYFVEQITK